MKYHIFNYRSIWLLGVYIKIFKNTLLKKISGFKIKKNTFCQNFLFILNKYFVSIHIKNITSISIRKYSICNKNILNTRMAEHELSNYIQSFYKTY